MMIIGLRMEIMSSGVAGVECLSKRSNIEELVAHSPLPRTSPKGESEKKLSSSVHAAQRYREKKRETRAKTERFCRKKFPNDRKSEFRVDCAWKL